MSANYQQKSPSYYVRKRLLENKPAVFGIVVILIAHLIVAMGHLILPDPSPNADNGSLVIQKKPPGFTTVGMWKRPDNPSEERPWWHVLISGQPPLYNYLPLDTLPVIKGDTMIHYTLYDSRQEKTIPLVDCMRFLMLRGRGEPLPSTVKDWPKDEEGVTYFKDGIHYYITPDEKVESISHEALVKEFEEQFIETRTFYFGTDKMGRDMFSRLLLGTRISLGIGFVSALISLILGVSLGAASGFFGGIVDSVILWFMTVVWSVPGIMLVIVITIALGDKSAWVVFVAVGVTMWVDIARVVRGQIISIKEKLYIEAARAFGLSNRRVILHHIMPNLLGSIIVISTANFASAILIEAGLSFMGLGVQPPQPSWGSMILEGYKALGTRNSWHLVFFPCFAISTMVLAFNLFGNGLRDAYDPQNMK